MQVGAQDRGQNQDTWRECLIPIASVPVVGQVVERRVEVRESRAANLFRMDGHQIKLLLLSWHWLLALCWTWQQVVRCQHESPSRRVNQSREKERERVTTGIASNNGRARKHLLLMT